jgi:hypothetical protein
LIFIIYYLFIYLIVFLLFQAWARREAIAREKIMENGGEVEFGKWYQSAKFEETEIDLMPVELEEE